MARTKVVNGVRVPLSPAEELVRDSEEAAWASGAAGRLRAASRETLRADIRAEVASLSDAARANLHRSGIIPGFVSAIEDGDYVAAKEVFSDIADSPMKTRILARIDEAI